MTTEDQDPIEKGTAMSDKKRYQQDEMMDGGDDRGGGRKLLMSGGSRRKSCRFCSDAEYVLDYKNWRVMQSFVSEHGRIVPRRISGTCALHQRALTTALKRARNLAMIGYTSSGAF